MYSRPLCRLGESPGAAADESRRKPCGDENTLGHLSSVPAAKRGHLLPELSLFSRPQSLSVTFDGDRGPKLNEDCEGIVKKQQLQVTSYKFKTNGGESAPVR
jgi:hypothetical protein